MRQRSSYPKQFKAQVVQECLQPGATISNPRHQRQRHSQVATSLPGSASSGAAGVCSFKAFA